MFVLHCKCLLYVLRRNDLKKPEHDRFKNFYFIFYFHHKKEKKNLKLKFCKSITVHWD